MIVTTGWWILGTPVKGFYLWHVFCFWHLRSNKNALSINGSSRPDSHVHILPLAKNSMIRNKNTSIIPPTVLFINTRGHLLTTNKGVS